ncbi:MAG TPA: hypothetical protein DDZ51_14290 [Planctomycetaceae bacterium]|nr:hypothetical protein [Planctomycetaceae bacterium]
MLTATLPTPSLSESRNSNQIETIVSDAEISARVLRIRSGWSVQERVERRREAERRFANLIESLGAI